MHLPEIRFHLHLLRFRTLRQSHPFPVRFSVGCDVYGDDYYIFTKRVKKINTGTLSERILNNIDHTTMTYDFL